MPDEVTTAFQNLSQELDTWQKNTFVNGIWYTLLYAAIIGVVTATLIRVLSRFFKKKEQGNLKFFYRLIYVVIIFISVCMVLMTITPLRSMGTTLLAGSGLVAVVIGLAAQATLANIFSGISIGASKPFLIGEQIEVVGQNIVGFVTEISLRQTVIRDFNNKRIAIPNSVIDKEIIRTSQLGDSRAICNFLLVSVGYGTDVEQAIGFIRQAALAHPDFLDVRTEEQIQAGAQKDVAVAVVNLGPSSIDLRASIWSKDAGTGFMMLSDLRRTIAKGFTEGALVPPVSYYDVALREK